ncbi:hypothetical protein [uncultured Pseudodesulfovibrio sp.]|uniref:hypothetical protein n=1 Tax=uncultured Pseudodesulfovibrio sp. TaxID=2035858 RepID=UPI0029C67A81|nr:hypothetical protein [uncultured Pseudodesulfovibrio sp.]
MNSVQKSGFVPVKEFPDYEMNREGVVRKIGGPQLTVLYSSTGRPYVAFRKARKNRSRSINVLLVENFGPGAAEAVGMPEPDMNRVKTQRELARRPRSGKSLGQDARIGITSTCHGCKKPCINYYCDECWIEKRGFGMDDTSRTHADLYGN